MNLGLVTILMLTLAIACAPGRPHPSGVLPVPPEPLPPEPGEEPEPPAAPEPLELVLQVGGAGLREADQAQVIDAFNTIEEATNGQVVIEAVFSDTVCDQPYAIHFVPQGQCGMRCWTENGEERCAHGCADANWTITITLGHDLDRLYFIVLHEIGHELGLEHGEGFMTQADGDATQTFFTKEQLDRIATVNHLDRAAMPADGARFEYTSHRQRIEPFIVYQE